MSADVAYADDATVAPSDSRTWPAMGTLLALRVARIPLASPPPLKVPMLGISSWDAWLKVPPVVSAVDVCVFPLTEGYPGGVGGRGGTLDMVDF